MSDENESAASVAAPEAAAPEVVAESEAVATPVEPAVAAPVVDEGPLGARFAALARREKEILQRERATKDAAAKRDAELAERLAKAESIEKKRAAWSDDPLGLLEELGVTYQQLTERVLKHGEPATAEDRVAKLEARLEAEAKARDEAAAKAAEDVKSASAAKVESSINAFKSSIKDFVSAGADTYEMIAAEDAHELVFDVIEAGYEKDGTMMSVEQAAALVESHLYETAVAKLKTSKKLAALFAPPPAPPAPVPTVAPPGKPKATPSVQLSNKVATPVAVAPSTEKQPMLSAREIAEKHVRERKARARAGL